METGIFFGNIKDAYPNIADELLILKKANELGFSYLELDIEDLLTKEPAFFENADLIEIGFSVYCFTDEKGKMKNGMYAEDCLSFLNEHHINTMMAVCCADCIDKSDTTIQDSIISTLNRLCEKAEEYGITVLAEDFDSHSIPCGSCEDMIFFGEKIPKLKYTFDTGNFAFFGEDALVCFEKLKNRICHVHLKDRVSVDNLQVTVTGNGGLRIKDIIEKLIASGYYGKMSIELFGAVNSPDDIVSSLNFVNSVILRQQ